MKYGSPIDYFNEGCRVAPTRSVKYSPVELRQRFMDYLEFMRTKVWHKAERIKSGYGAGMLVSTPTQAPLSLESFLIYAGMGRKTYKIYQTNPAYDDICDWIETCIDNQNFEGALVGAYNANLVARRLKLAEKTESEVDANQTIEITIV